MFKEIGNWQKMRLGDKLRLEKEKSHKISFEGEWYLEIRHKIYKKTILSLMKAKKCRSHKGNFIKIINFYLISYLFLSFAKQKHKTFIFKVTIQI